MQRDARFLVHGARRDPARTNGANWTAKVVAKLPDGKTVNVTCLRYAELTVGAMQARYDLL